MKKTTVMLFCVWNVLSEGACGIQVGVVNQAEDSSLGSEYLPIFNARW